MRKCLFFLLALLLLTPACSLAEKYQSLPPMQAVTQSNERVFQQNNVTLNRMHVQTANPAVTQEVEDAFDLMTARGREHLPKAPLHEKEGAVMYVGASVTRTGEKWMSFLMTANLLDGREQTYVDLDACAFDMETGKRLTLADVVKDSAYDLIRAEARRQLSAYFPAMTADEEKLSALANAAETAPFTLNTAFLQLHFRADSLYDGRASLMHVRIPYALLREHMTEEALLQTDNSRYNMVAITYDDGPTRSVTRSIALSLRRSCAGATFFVVGSRIRNGHDLLCFAHDMGFTQGSHTYDHKYDRENEGTVALSRDQVIAELGTVTGAGVMMMRAPGGIENVFVREHVGLPLINWTLSSGDASEAVKAPLTQARKVAWSLNDGDILLCHDLRKHSAEMADTICQILTERGFLCVTIEELFAVKGISLEADAVYYHAR